MSAPVIPMRPAAICRCCGGRGVVPDAVGEPRPCSRCCSDAFDRWSADRRQESAAASLAASVQKGAGAG